MASSQTMQNAQNNLVDEYTFADAIALGAANERGLIAGAQEHETFARTRARIALHHAEMTDYYADRAQRHDDHTQRHDDHTQRHDDHTQQYITRAQEHAANAADQAVVAVQHAECACIYVAEYTRRFGIRHQDTADTAAESAESAELAITNALEQANIAKGHAFTARQLSGALRARGAAP